jgi:hypothetical protein
MQRISFIQAALFSVALAILASPALTSAQAGPQGSSSGGGWVLLAIFAGLVIAITMFTRSQRRKLPKNAP